MGKLIAVIGNSGVGKTTFVRKISEKAGLIQCVEEHEFEAVPGVIRSAQAGVWV